MKAICIMNLKGGVAKTTTAINMAAILADKYHKRVLLVDADHQGNTSKFFRASTELGSIRDVLMGFQWSSLICHPLLPAGVSVLPADITLAELDVSDVKEKFGVDPVLQLREYLSMVEENDSYDYVVIDMPPAFSVAAKAALVAADEVIIPIKLDAFSVDGMAEMTRQIASMRKVNPKLRLAGVLITMWRNIDIIRQAEDVLRSGAVPVFKTTIRRTDRVDESTFERKPLYIYSPNCAACVDYKRLVTEYLEGGGSRG